MTLSAADRGPELGRVPEPAAEQDEAEALRAPVHVDRGIDTPVMRASLRVMTGLTANATWGARVPAQGVITSTTFNITRISTIAGAALAFLTTLFGAFYSASSESPPAEAPGAAAPSSGADSVDVRRPRRVLHHADDYGADHRLDRGHNDRGRSRCPRPRTRHGEGGRGDGPPTRFVARARGRPSRHQGHVVAINPTDQTALFQQTLQTGQGSSNSRDSPMGAAREDRADREPLSTRRELRGPIHRATARERRECLCGDPVAP